MKATAIAHNNIALVKYWGKRNRLLNLPAVGSISITLRDLFTRSTVTFKKELDRDVFYLNNSAADSLRVARVSQFLDLIRQQAKIKDFAEIISENNFPTAAGLASSASGFAALTLAACRAAHLALNLRELSILARQGSGSAARSILGGYVEMKRGTCADGSDAYAVPLADETFWPLHILVIITSDDEKEIGSTAGMELTASTSPFYRDWLTTSRQDLEEMRASILNRDLQMLGEIAERSCLKMHALAMTAHPTLIYWNGTTVKLMRAIQQLRRQGSMVYFTVDAGPQVKAICAPQESQRMGQTLEQIKGVNRVLITSLGPAAKIIED